MAEAKENYTRSTAQERTLEQILVFRGKEIFRDLKTFQSSQTLKLTVSTMV